eukprot:jgi/Tetstr1/464538/TSEL_009295.t1
MHHGNTFALDVHIGGALRRNDRDRDGGGGSRDNFIKTTRPGREAAAPRATFAKDAAKDFDVDSAQVRQAQIWMRAEDTAGVTDVGTVQVTIINTPDPPAAAGSRVEGVWLGEEAVRDVLAVDPDGDAVWVYITQEPSKGVLRLTDEQPTQPGSSRLKGRNPLSYNAPAHGTPVMEEVTFQFVAVDGAAEPAQMSVPAMVSLVLRNPAAQDNTPPEALPLEVASADGRRVTGAFKATDDTSRASQISYQVLVPPDLGSVTIRNGTFANDPDLGAHGNDSFIYVALYHFSPVSNPARVSILIEERNDPPVPACEPSAQLLNEGSALRDAVMGTVTISDMTAAGADSADTLASVFVNETNTARSSRHLISLTALKLVLTESRLARFQWACSAVTQVLSPMATGDGGNGVEVALLAYDTDERVGFNHTLLNAADLRGSIAPLEVVLGNSSADDASVSAGGLSPAAFMYTPPPLQWGFR